MLFQPKLSVFSFWSTIRNGTFHLVAEKNRKVTTKCLGMKLLKMTNRDENRGRIREPLPQDIIIEILSRIPVQYLLGMRCVCKQWNDLIEDSYFIQKHMSLAKNGYIGYFNKWKTRGNMDEADHHHNNEACKSEKFHLIRGCDGMLLKRNNASKKYIIENPTPRKILALPDSKHHLNLSITFSFVPSTGEYKLVSIYEDIAGGKEGCEVITAGIDDCWRHLQLPNSHGLNQRRRKLSVASAGVAVHCYKVTQVGGQIFEEVISLDLETECFTSTTLKPGVFSNWEKVLSLDWNGRPVLAETGREYIKVLVMEDYKKKHKLADNKFGVSLRGAPKVMQGDDIVPLVVENDALWIWLSNNKSFSYHVKRGKVLRQTSMIEGYHVGKTIYVGRASLVNLRGMQRQKSSRLV